MNYGDKHTEDSLVLRLGRLYGIERGLDCAPNITMASYRDENGWVTNYGVKKNGDLCGEYEADFLYITKGRYLYEVEIKLSIADFRADQQKTLYHNFPDVRGFYYCMPMELYAKHKEEVLRVCKEKDAGLIVESNEFKVIKKAPQRKSVEPLTDSRYLHYIRLFAKKWVRRRELIDECNIK